jgi:hypothetical protein
VHGWRAPLGGWRAFRDQVGRILTKEDCTGQRFWFSLERYEGQVTHSNMFLIPATKCSSYYQSSPLSGICRK